MLEKLKRGIDRGIASASLQSTTYLETNKLRTKIDELEARIQQEKTALGYRVYTDWTQRANCTQYINDTCQAIQALEQESENCRAKIAELQAEKERLLSVNTAPPDDSGVYCSCGERLSPDAKFCGACGKAAPIMATCPECGSRLAADARFCPNCGAAQQTGDK